MTEGNRAPRTFHGLRKGIVAVLKAHRKKGYIDWGTRRRIWQLSHTQLVRLYVMLHGQQAKEVSGALNAFLSTYNTDCAVADMRSYIEFHGVIRRMCQNYQNDGDAVHIVQWLSYNNASCPQAASAMESYAAVLRVMDEMRKGKEFSPISHASRLANVGVIDWAFKNPDRVEDALRTYKATTGDAVTPGMIKLQLEGPSEQRRADATAHDARAYIMDSVCGSKKADDVRAAVEEIPDDQIVSLYLRLTDPKGMAAHETIRDILAGYRDDDLRNFMKLYAANHDILHRIASAYEVGDSGPLEQMRWLEIHDIGTLSAEGYAAALSIVEKVKPRSTYVSSVPIHIGSLGRLGLLQTAYDRPDAIDRIIELHNENPSRHIDAGLLETHTALNEGWL